jgi:excisionase family DNA binding protein
MNKKDAAAYLGISPRALEYHAKQSHISVRYVKGKTGDVAEYDETELRELRAKIESQRAPRAAVSYESPESESRSIARPSPSAPLELLERLSALVGSSKTQPRANVGEKIMLTIGDAAALCSLSENFLREAIKAGTLKAKILGRGYKIKRPDLDAFIKRV